uniref:hypothetical protein n=1 Tax=Phellinidium ferrugineofuscum TaxID=167367 RepID=UPI0023AABABD|nr:hypothetical protein P1Q01_mgp04 [Phellinidium ferrugineofuscum]WCF76822.1 hypothetical protein [Phellinidium ferrugineofuscum]
MILDRAGHDLRSCNHSSSKEYLRPRLKWELLFCFTWVITDIKVPRLKLEFFIKVMNCDCTECWGPPRWEEGGVRCVWSKIEHRMKQVVTTPLRSAPIKRKTLGPTIIRWGHTHPYHLI